MDEWRWCKEKGTFPSMSPPPGVREGGGSWRQVGGCGCEPWAELGLSLAQGAHSEDSTWPLFWRKPALADSRTPAAQTPFSFSTESMGKTWNPPKARPVVGVLGEGLLSSLWGGHCFLSHGRVTLRAGGQPLVPAQTWGQRED